MKIALAGSIKFYPKIKRISQQLENCGHTIVFYPKPFKNETNAQISPSDKLKTMQKFNRAINKADALLVMNLAKNGIRNYIGVNTLMEIGASFTLGKKIFLFNPSPKNCSDEMEAIGALAIKQNLSKI